MIRGHLDTRRAEPIRQLQREGRRCATASVMPMRLHALTTSSWLASSQAGMALDELIPSELLGQDHLDVRRLLVDRLYVSSWLTTA